MQLRSHDNKPIPKFQGDDRYYLGIELEIEAPDYEKMRQGLGICKRPRFAIAKRDGSLNSFGWELVSHPIARKLWLEHRPEKKSPTFKMFSLIKDLQGLGYNSHDGGRCGLHVHVCRKAFDFNPGNRDVNGLPNTNMGNSTHYYWFQRLVNGKLFTKLSQREQTSLDRWTQQLHCHMREFKAYGKPRWAKRHVACNITRNTIEVRLFRGNMREGRIRKAVEAVIAAVEFTREWHERTPRETLATWAKELDSLFVRYAIQHRHKYPNLYKFLTEQNIVTIKTTEDREEEVLACV